jgi:hypothetical protein
VPTRDGETNARAEHGSGSGERYGTARIENVGRELSLVGLEVGREGKKGNWEEEQQKPGH